LHCEDEQRRYAPTPEVGTGRLPARGAMPSTLQGVSTSFGSASNSVRSTEVSVVPAKNP
jgi:hypothetical protein